MKFYLAATAMFVAATLTPRVSAQTAGCTNCGTGNGVVGYAQVNQGGPIGSGVGYATAGAPLAGGCNGGCAGGCQGGCGSSSCQGGCRGAGMLASLKAKFSGLGCKGMIGGCGGAGCGNGCGGGHCLGSCIKGGCHGIFSKGGGCLQIAGNGNCASCAAGGYNGGGNNCPCCGIFGPDSRLAHLLGRICRPMPNTAPYLKKPDYPLGFPNHPYMRSPRDYFMYESTGGPSSFYSGTGY